MTATEFVVTNNGYGGLPIAKNTNLRTGIYDKVVTGLHCGINLRLMRYSDVLLRAAECENEVNGPTAQAIEWINIVRRRAQLKDLQLADFNTADKLFEQIANVERPKEFGCEYSSIAVIVCSSSRSMVLSTSGRSLTMPTALSPILRKTPLPMVIAARAPMTALTMVMSSCLSTRVH